MVVGVLRRAVSRGLRRVVSRAMADEYVCGVGSERLTAKLHHREVG